RGTEADIRIDDASISRKHAVLSIGPKIRIKDLGSANGTRVANRSLESGEWAELSPGEVIDLGSVMLILMRNAEDPAEKPQPAGDGRSIARAENLLKRVAPGDIAVLITG